MACHHNMQIQITPSNRREIISVIKVLKQIKAPRFDGLPAELFIAAPAASADLLLPPTQKSWQSETFLREWKNGLLVKFPQTGTRVEGNSSKGFGNLVTLQGIPGKFNRQRAGWYSFWILKYLLHLADYIGRVRGVYISASPALLRFDRVNRAGSAVRVLETFERSSQLPS